MSEFSDIEIRIGSGKMLVNIDYAHHEFVQSLINIEKTLLERRGLIVKNQRKIRVVRMPLTVDGKTIDCHVKQYRVFSVRKQLENLVAPAKASLAWKGAKRLLARNIETPEPLAAIEIRKFGIPRESYFISKTIPGAVVSVLYFRKILSRETAVSRRDFVRAMAGALRRLHEANIYHNDLKDHNILVSPEKQSPFLKFWFLDVDCVSRFRGMTVRRRIRNLAQMNRTLGREMKMTDKMVFFREYFGLAGKERLSPRQKKMIRKVFRQSRETQWGSHRDKS